MLLVNAKKPQIGQLDINTTKIACVYHIYYFNKLVKSQDSSYTDTRLRYVKRLPSYMLATVRLFLCHGFPRSPLLKSHHVQKHCQINRTRHQHRH
jgi:hypothetical protein